MQTNFYDKFQELRNTGNPFVVATVIRAEKPTSAKVGAKAIITEDGTLNGWIGGSCAEPTVKREAKKALPDGLPRLNGSLTQNPRTVPFQRRHYNQFGGTHVRN